MRLKPAKKSELVRQVTNKLTPPKYRWFDNIPNPSSWTLTSKKKKKAALLVNKTIRSTNKWLTRGLLLCRLTDYFIITWKASDTGTKRPCRPTFIWNVIWDITMGRDAIYLILWEGKWVKHFRCWYKAAQKVIVSRMNNPKFWPFLRKIKKQITSTCYFLVTIQLAFSGLLDRIMSLQNRETWSDIREIKFTSVLPNLRFVLRNTEK